MTRLAALPAALALWAAAASAEEPLDLRLGGSLSVVSENDKWAAHGQDRHYTNGLRLGWVSDPLDPGAGLADFARRLPMFAGARDLRLGFAIGQSIFTPADIEATQPDPADRPYAGWLYAAAALIGERFEGDRPTRLDTLELALGVIGPAAGAAHMQNRWHSLIGVAEAEGWAHQIPTQVGVVLSYERRWRTHFATLAGLDPGLGIDVIPHAGLSLGNILTYAAGGATLRFGRNLEIDWGPERIRPGLSGTGYLRHGDGFGWYLFAGIEARAVAYNAFLDGPWFRASPDVEKKPLVADFQAGAAFTWERLRFAYSYVVRTRQFDGQDGVDRFAAFTLTTAF